MSKTDTVILKGVAMLLMLYLHLFNQIDNVNLCTTYLYIGDIPFVYIFSRCTSPVSFFIILSGYGLYISYQNGKRDSVTRVLRLYIHYWITLLLFIPLGAYIIGLNLYPGSFETIMQNVVGWDTTYNAEAWFLFPYILLAFTYLSLFSYIDRIKTIWIFLGTGILYFVANFVIHLYAVNYLYDHRLTYWPLIYISFLFPFAIGMIMAKYKIIGKIKEHCPHSNTLLCLSLLLLLGARLLIDTSIFNPIYVGLFIILFVLIRRPIWLDNALFKIGQRSTSMWLVHSYFCYYFFHDFIYGFRYPLLIYLILLALSYQSAIIVDYISVKIQYWVKLK